MAEVMIFEGSADLVHQYRVRYGLSPHGLVSARRYCGGDSRIGWRETYLVTDDRGILGFSNGPLDPELSRVTVTIHRGTG